MPLLLKKKTPPLRKRKESFSCHIPELEIEHEGESKVKPEGKSEVTPVIHSGECPEETAPVPDRPGVTTGFPSVKVPHSAVPQDEHKAGDQEPQTTKKSEAPPVSEPIGGAVQRLGKTTAKYIGTFDGETIYPVVGWLVCVKGVYYGQAFPLRTGFNTIGRSHDMIIGLLRDESVSGTTALKISYDSVENEFYAIPGESNKICYIAGTALYEVRKLNGFEEIMFGDSGASMYVFVPLCGEKFRWAQYPTQN
jgi:hypothetical protein